MTTLHTVNLTDHQKEVLVRVFTAATPELAKAEVEFGEKEIAAGEVLKNLDAIEVTDKTARVTATGVDLMRQQGILDDSDQLTKEVEQYKTGDNANVTDDVDIEPQDDMSDIDADLGGDMGDDLGGDMGDDLGGMGDDSGGLEQPPEDLNMGESLIRDINKSLIIECSMNNSHKNKQRKSLKRAISARKRTFKKS
jgi:hypothetical protein